jgi:hypothetical protein
MVYVVYVNTIRICSTIGLLAGNLPKISRLHNKSRMTGDCHVRFCEKLGVKFP